MRFQYTAFGCISQAPGYLLGKSTPAQREPQGGGAHWTPFLRVGGVLVITRTTRQGHELNQHIGNSVLALSSFPGAGLLVDAGMGLRPGPTPLETKTLSVL